MSYRRVLRRFPVTLVRSVVIAGLDPAIHPLRTKMDAQVKPAHDGGETESTKSDHALAFATTPRPIASAAASQMAEPCILIAGGSQLSFRRKSHRPRPSQLHMPSIRSLLTIRPT